MPRNIRLLIAYDGTEFHGWQHQPGLRTVQECIQQAIRRVVHHQVSLIGSGRTDAGVHARGQVANFETTCEIPCDNLRKAIGSRVPKDISILRADEVPLGFRATFDAVSKLYRYSIHNAPGRPVEEMLQRYRYHFWHPLDVHRMRQAAALLVGTHDFAAFASKGSERESTVRTVLRIEIYRRYEQIHVDVEGTGFLYNQVRNMVGTLIEIGRGHWPPEYAGEILASRDRSKAGPTAPARGLCLEWVRYDLTRPTESYIRRFADDATPRAGAPAEVHDEMEVE
ncbi:MAG TPA: tRNA pseudouridine(38-40) synthase TruA [Phycisphaerae bacterium]|nr:tRNA pseudouridine(38-40) synthase TruA [Phycisphaerae bacterium]HOJ75839.1 tRNA pseudouridine(38-40) synthase TruA [Phycisphaerae bacterium]HOM53225.1 tRNA pseudouridine(38-40) synthase TruA [Phycisphaerae bacterium]HON68098.1 tRNA pseudouridine(38-40) synthase TruA [Phycisphaerae bacterium]HOQ86021.1 tRNA pseudouridine(38-40) synthase TruA [Phycisphaerae bacterium]